MRRKLGVIGLIVLLSASLGCSTLLKHDQQNTRDAILDLYTEQIMDNLIRLKNGYPILQVDYTRVTGQITNTQEVRIGGTRESESTRFGQIPPYAKVPVDAIFSPVKIITKTFTYLFDANSNQQLAITAEPVINNKLVYLPYLNFLDLEDRTSKDPKHKNQKLSSIMSTCTIPNTALCHMGYYKKFNGKYYYVPPEFSDAFCNLSLAVISKGCDTYKIPLYYRSKIETTLSTSTTDLGKSYDVKIRLSKPIYNDDGRIIIRVAGIERSYSIKYSPSEASQPGKGSSDDEMVDQVTIRFIPSKENISLDKFIDEIKEADIKVRLDHHIPDEIVPAEILRDIRNTLDQIRMNQSLGTR